MSRLVTLVNRSSKSLKGTWDGRHYDITPGKHEFPEIQAQKFKDQNPIMGTENPRTLVRQSLIGIVEFGDDTSPIEQSDEVELFDRGTMTGGKDAVKIIHGNGMYSPRLEESKPFNVGGQVESNFTKP